MTPCLSRGKNVDEKVIAAEVIGYKTTLVHLGFALVSRIYDRGARMYAKHAVIRREYKWGK